MEMKPIYGMPGWRAAVQMIPKPHIDTVINSPAVTEPEPDDIIKIQGTIPSEIVLDASIIR